MSPIQIYTLSLHDALPIFNKDVQAAQRAEDLERHRIDGVLRGHIAHNAVSAWMGGGDPFNPLSPAREDRKSTRLNSSHLGISYAVFCLKKKKNITTTSTHT